MVRSDFSNPYANFNCIGDTAKNVESAFPCCNKIKYCNSDKLNNVGFIVAIGCR